MPPKITHWQLRTRALPFSSRPLLMGILNVTPDSFSDGGEYFSVQRAVDRAKQMEDEGADILDLGGESTRPYSTPVDLEEELQRVIPVLEKLQGKVGLPISIDTTKKSVAEAAIQLGAEIINDISGLRRDPEMMSFAAKSQAGICAMHIQGTPETMQDSPSYINVTQDIYDWLREVDQQLLASGVSKDRICLDPGIGFGKTHEHNLELLKNVARFHGLQRPLLVGHSRKGFIAKVLGDKSADRMFGTLGVSLALAASGIQVLRVHDVRANRQALELFVATRGDA